MHELPERLHSIETSCGIPSLYIHLPWEKFHPVTGPRQNRIYRKQYVGGSRHVTVTGTAVILKLPRKTVKRISRIFHFTAFVKNLHLRRRRNDDFASAVLNVLRERHDIIACR